MRENKIRKALNIRDLKKTLEIIKKISPDYNKSISDPTFQQSISEFLEDFSIRFNFKKSIFVDVTKILSG